MNSRHYSPWLRLPFGIWVAGRHNGASESSCEHAVAGCTEAYRLHMADLAEQPLLARSYERLDLDRLRMTTTQKTLRKEIKRAARRAKRANRRPGHTPPHRTTPRNPPHHRRPAAGHPPVRARARTGRRSAGRLPADTAAAVEPRSGGHRLVDIVHKVVGSALSDCGPTSLSAKAAARTT